MKKENKKRLNAFYGEVGKFLLDVAKLVIGGVLLAGIMQDDIRHGLLYGIGSAIVIILIVVGMILIWLSNSNE